MPKNPNAVALGRRGGKIGGKATSPAKLAAVRLNVAKARKVKKENAMKKCKTCPKILMGAEQLGEVCNECLTKAAAKTLLEGKTPVSETMR